MLKKNKLFDTIVYYGFEGTRGVVFIDVVFVLMNLALNGFHSLRESMS